MEREEALEKFTTLEAKEILERAGRALFESIDANRIEIQSTLIDYFEKVVDLWRGLDKKFEVSCIHFSCLRVHIMDSSYIWHVELQGPNGDYDKQHVECMMDMSHFFSFLESYRQELQDAGQKYVGNITPADCDRLFLKMFFSKMYYFYFLGIKAFEKIDLHEKFKSLTKKEVFHITLGERRDKSFILAQDGPRKPLEEVVTLLTKEPKEEDLSSNEFLMYPFHYCQLYEKTIALRNLLFLRARNCQFEWLEIIGSKLMLSDFSETVFDHCAVHFCTFQGSNFEHCRITDSLFCGNHFGIVPYQDDITQHLAFIPASFVNATLTNVNFDGCFMSGCDFRGAELENVTFDQVDLMNAIFEKKYKDILTLSEIQMKQIHWVN